MMKRMSFLLAALTGFVLTSCAEEQATQRGERWRATNIKYHAQEHLAPPADVTTQPDGSIIVGGQVYRRAP